MTRPRPRPQLMLGDLNVLHRGGCSAVRREPDRYSPRFDGISSRDVALAVDDLDLKTCRACRPLKALAWWEHQQHKRDRSAPVPVPSRADGLAETIRLHRFSALDEDALQRSLALLLRGRREVTLSAGGRVDLVVDGVAIEVKVAGSAETVFRQVQGYAKSVEVQELLIVTTKTAHLDLPPIAGGKHLVVVLAKGTI